MRRCSLCLQRPIFIRRGIYFAEKSEYSHSYAFKPRVCCDDRTPGQRDEREMFLAKLLTGRDTFMSRDNPAKAELCSKLVLPPVMDQSTGRRFSSVTGTCRVVWSELVTDSWILRAPYLTRDSDFTGKAGGSKIWIVYENGRAYPDYLVRYYRGDRDPQRTPFASRLEAIGNSIPEGPSPEQQAPLATWEYLDNEDCWKPYSKEHQVVLENTFQSHGRDPSSSPSNVNIQGSRWMYRVNVADMTQTNVEHSSRTQRSVRRKQPLSNTIFNI